MAAIFSFIGFLGVLAGAAATAAGLYETFGETQKAVDAWVSGAQVFFSGAMLMALGSVAARVRGTTRSIDELAKAVKALRGELVSTRSPAEPANLSDRSVSDSDPMRDVAARRREPEDDPREPVLERRPPGSSVSGQAMPGPGRSEPPTAAKGPSALGGTGIGAGSQRRTRLGPALDEGRDGGSEPSRRGSRLRRPFDDE